MSDLINSKNNFYTSTSFYDYWLRGESKESIYNALLTANISIHPTTVSSFDFIGQIWKKTEIFDENENPIFEPIDGWHANLRLSHPLSEKQLNDLSHILIERPNNPTRVWA